VLHPGDVVGVVAPLVEVAHPARRERLQRLVESTGVVRVVEVLEHHLPVPREIGQRLARAPHRGRELEVLERCFQLGQRRRQRRRVGIEAGEDEALPDLHPQAGKAVLLLVERDRPLHRGRPEQTAIEAVAPVVIRACELRAAAGALSDDHAAVPAHRRQDADDAAPVADDYQRLVDDLERVPVAWLRDLALAADAEPCMAEDRFLLEREPRRGDVELRREKTCLVHVSDRFLEAGERLVVYPPHQRARPRTRSSLPMIRGPGG
jgi:hypothetical protein